MPSFYAEDPEKQFVADTMAYHDLYFYSRWKMLETRGIKWQKAQHHKKVADALTRVFEGKCKRLIINMPPRYSKTQQVLDFVTWVLGKVPDAQFIFTSYSGRLAATNSWQAREDVKSEVYQRIFERRTILDDSSSARDEWRTTNGGLVYAVGVGGSCTGYGAGLMRDAFGGAIIIDDALKAEEARSDIMRKNCNDWYMGTLQSRVNSPDTPIIVICQRLHEEDLAGFLLNGGSGEKWELICFPAIQEDGTALWPEKHSIEKLMEMERAAPYMFAGQYMQRPSPIQGGIFQPDNLNFVWSPPKIVDSVRGWDFGSTVDGDPTSGIHLGKTEDGRYCILDRVSIQDGPDKVEKLFKATAERDGPRVRVGFPQDPGQAGKFQTSHLAKQLAGFRILASPESGDKVTRAEPIAAQINLGNVDIVRADWNAPVIDQMRLFPNAKHDDDVDALSRAFMTLTSGHGPMTKGRVVGGW